LHLGNLTRRMLPDTKGGGSLEIAVPKLKGGEFKGWALTHCNHSLVAQLGGVTNLGRDGNVHRM
jgi:hypothetical protein